MALKYFLAQKTISADQHKWVHKLWGLDYEIQFRKGKENIVANALSRKVLKDKPSSVDYMAITSVISELTSKVKESWKADDKLKAMIQQLEEGSDKFPKFSWTNQTMRRRLRQVSQILP